MSTADVPDFTSPITLVSGPLVTDFSDWTEAVQDIGGGGGGGGPVSLSGAGETTTPGDLVQAGGFTVNDSAGHGITLDSATGVITIEAPGPGVGVGIEANGAGSGIVLTTTGANSFMIIGDQPSTGVIDMGGGGVNVHAGTPLSTLPGSVLISADSTGGVIIQTASGGTVKVQNASAGHLSFFGVTGTTKTAVTGSRVSGAALTNLLTALANYGLITDSTTT
jgi:hypothetical protein